MFSLRLPLLAALVYLCSLSSYAAPGVTESAVTFGMSAPLTGADSEGGLALKSGVEIYLRHVNESGGVFGRKIRLLALDDANDPAQTLRNTTQMLADDSVLALTSYYGNAAAEAVVPLLEETGTPLIGVASGAESLRQPAQHYLFNLRAGYQDEADAMVFQLDSEGLTRIAIFYQNDADDKNRFTGLKRSIAKLSLRPTVIASGEPDGHDLSKAAGAIAATRPQAVILIAPPKVAVAVMLQIQKSGAFPQCMALLAQSDKDALAHLGAQGRGLGVTQVVPDTDNATVPVVKQYLKLLKQYGISRQSSYGLEGFLNAKLAVEALRRAGRAPSRQRLLTALESNYDLGGYELHFAPDNHNGSHYVEMAIVRRDGKLLH